MRGFTLAYSFVLRDILTWSIAVYRPDIGVPPATHMEELTTVPMGLPGMGGLRTAEKISGRAR